MRFTEIIGQILKALGLIAVVVSPLFCLVSLFYDFVVFERPVFFYSYVLLLMSAVSVPVGVVLLLAGYALTGPKKEGWFGKPPSSDNWAQGWTLSDDYVSL
jgi:hypothetical protein